MLKLLRYKGSLRPLTTKDLWLNFEKDVLKTQQRHQSTEIPALPESADVVIIGGGSAGCNTLYQLSKRGVKAVLLEKAKVTAGETWHSAGLILQMRMSDTEMQLRSATKNLLGVLQEETGVDPKWVNNGAIYLARSKVRMDEYKRMSTLAKNFNIETHLLSPAETKDLFPLLDTALIQGALYCPSDGVVDPTAFCQALNTAAINGGAEIIENCPVTKIITGKSQFGYKQVEGVQTPFGTIKTKCIVNATGAWAGKLSQMAGLDVPIVPLLHAYVVSSPMQSITRTLPNVKDSDGSIYFRVKGDSLCVGGFEHNPIFLDQLSEDHAFELFELDWKVFDAHMQNAIDLVPQFETAGIKTTVCGTETFTPDLKPLIGEDPRLLGFYHMCGFNASGVVLSGGCGEQLAKWIIHGRPDFHMYRYDIRRFTPEQMVNKAWAKERCHESYVNNYKIIYPHDEPLAGRNLKQDPFYEELLVAGAVYEELQAYERPGWFNPQGYCPIPAYDWYGAYGTPKNLDKRYITLLKGDKTFGFSKHHLVIGSECLACREQVAMMDFSYFCKLYMIGPDTQRAADWLFTADTDVPFDQVVYTCLLNDSAGIEADLTVVPIRPGTGTMANPIFKGRGMYIVAGGASASQTRAHIMSVIKKKGFKVDITDFSSQVGLLSIQGPASRELLQNLVDCDLSDANFPYKTSRIIKLAGIEVRAMRTSYVGELGWEIHVPEHACIPVYLALWEVGRNYGLRHAGYRALYSLCSEKGYRLWNSDVRVDDNPVEAGLDYTCRSEGDYLGKKALDEVLQNGIKKRHVFITVTDSIPLYGMETIWRNGEIVGYLRRGEYGFSLGCSIAQGYVRCPNGENVTTEFIESGDYEVEVLGVRHKAQIHLKSPFDPENKRLQGIYDDPLPVRQSFEL
ncbi:sarcosine dehydrogenase, mitochondrial [Halyomorpha halys]|uniref:sarcosine dehydrogenase, mitochondrial n=1 Tax=Halyomorpha halys TaxID=286706 RepID=UPI0006D521D1|nr:sarcosine dehydrogenase, mitochondrial [Halyomorpha halys]XP_014291644.1 sarcosine dehydrogenase, mitochondrial [Halyomorpha halys]